VRLPVRQRFKGGNLVGGDEWINLIYMEFAFLMKFAQKRKSALILKI